MFALAYLSNASPTFRDEDFSDLIVLASAKNRGLGITGFLQYGDGQFFQYLEGNEDIVLALMDTIAQDPRHRVLRVVHLPEIKSRQFDDWHMRRITRERLISMDLVGLLESMLLGMDSLSFEKSYVEAKIMRLVKRLAEHHRKFPSFFDI